MLETGKGRWRVPTGPPQGETQVALSRSAGGHTSIKASDAKLDAGHPAGRVASAEMTQGMQNQNQWSESRRAAAHSRTRTGLGCLGSGSWVVSQNLGTSLPVSAQIKEAMILVKSVRRLLFTSEDSQIFLQSMSK